MNLMRLATVAVLIGWFLRVRDERAVSSRCQHALRHPLGVGRIRTCCTCRSGTLPWSRLAASSCARAWRVP